MDDWTEYTQEEIKNCPLVKIVAMSIFKEDEKDRHPYYEKEIWEIYNWDGYKFQSPSEMINILKLTSKCK